MGLIIDHLCILVLFVDISLHVGLTVSEQWHLTEDGDECSVFFPVTSYVELVEGVDEL